MRNSHLSFVRNPHKRLQSTGLFVILLMALSSCDRGDSERQEQMYGRWEIAKAERNGKETTYLRGGYFIIGQDGNMTTNITGSDEKAPFKLEKNKLVMKDKSFDLQTITNDSMILKYAPGPNSQFLFYLLKKK